MNALAPELLFASRLSWQVPELWEAYCFGEPIPAGEALTLALLRRLAHPVSALEVFRDLLARGEFAAAEQLTEEPSFLAELGERHLPRLHAELAEARQSELRALQGWCDFLRRRASQTALRIDHLDERLDAALEQAATRSAPAKAQIEALEKAVEELEERELTELRSRLAEHPAGGAEIEGEWRQLVERSLDGRDLPVARWLLDEGPVAEVAEHTVPSRPRWPYTEPTTAICEWFLTGKNRPVDFAYWQPDAREADPAAYAFLEVLAPLLDNPSLLSAARVAQLVHRLEALLAESGRVESVAPPVEERGGVFWTLLRGAESPWLPALGPALHSGGLPIMVTGATAPGQEESPYPFALHFDLTEASPLGERYLRWTPRTLFRYLGNRRHRRHQLLQDLGARIPLDLVLPAGTPLSDGVLLEGRERELERLATGASWQLILGTRGIGKTSLLERAARELERAGWRRLELRVLESDPGATAERLGSALGLWHRSSQSPPENAAAAADWVSGLVPERLLVTMDDAQFLSEWPGGGAVFELLAGLVAAGGGRIHCWLASTHALAGGLPVLPAGLRSEVFRLSALPQLACRRLVQSLLDYLWVSLRPPQLLDRLVFYSGGHPQILFLLLREMFDRRGRLQGRAPFNDSQLEDAWHSPALRREATSILLAPLDGRADLRLALGYILQLAGEGISEDELSEFIAEHGLTLAVVDELCEEGIVERSTRAGTRVRLPSSGLGQLIADRLGSGEQLVEEAQACWSGATREPSGTSR